MEITMTVYYHTSRAESSKSINTALESRSCDSGRQSLEFSGRMAVASCDSHALGTARPSSRGASQARGWKPQATWGDIASRGPAAELGH